ncbi:G-PROTEIN-RECEP-F1-2 domain-containing protein [Aphelenchoides bicaudatus]|nr:G-PROTEIN-RECEP-F1-2 domain-containing protein [Aphelenchoides bicaudatus]
MDSRIMEPIVDYEQNGLHFGAHSELENCTCRIVHDDMNLFNAIFIIGFLPILSILGLVANAINMYIYSKTSSSAERYLMALSISDFGVCASGILVITSDSVRAHSFFIDQLFTLLLPKLIPFGLFFQMCSIYITVTAALDCFVKVSSCFVTRSRNYCTVSNANKILVGVFFCTAVYNIIQFAELEAVKCFSHEMGIEIYELCPTSLRLDETYITFYRGYLYAITMAFLPFFILTVLTSFIIWELNRRKACKILNRTVETFHDYVVISEQVENNKPVEADTSSPFVLVMVVLLFLGCSFVSLLVNILEMTGGSLSHDIQMALIDVGNFLVVFNATANIFIYVCSNAYFRNQVFELFGIHKPPEKMQQTQL